MHKSLYLLRLEIRSGTATHTQTTTNSTVRGSKMWMNCIKLITKWHNLSSLRHKFMHKNVAIFFSAQHFGWKWKTFFLSSSSLKYVTFLGENRKKEKKSKIWDKYLKRRQKMRSCVHFFAAAYYCKNKMVRFSLKDLSGITIKWDMSHDWIDSWKRWQLAGHLRKKKFWIWHESIHLLDKFILILDKFMHAKLWDDVLPHPLLKKWNGFLYVMQ